MLVLKSVEFFEAMFGSWGSDFPLCHSRPSMQLSMYVVSEELSKKYVWHRARREDYKWPPISLWVWHRLRMHDGYFPYSFRTMSYLGFISVRSEKQSFYGKKQLNYGNHGQGTHSAKMGADSSAKNIPKFIRTICQIGQKVWDIVEKKLHWTSIARVFNVCKLFLWYYPKCRK